MITLFVVSILTVSGVLILSRTSKTSPITVPTTTPPSIKEMKLHFLNPLHGLGDSYKKNWY